MKHFGLTILSLVLTLAVLGQTCQAESAATKPATQPAAPAGEPKISLKEAMILGVVEGLTEYLPVSSTGHLIIAGHAMGHSKFSDEQGPFGRKLETTEATGAFDIVIQLGAILAVLGLYRKRVVQMGKGLLGRDPKGLRLVGLLMTAFTPALIMGLLFHAPIKEYLFSPITVCWALAIGGVVMIIIEQLYERRPNLKRIDKMDHIRYRQALIIGLAQCIAMWPGTSRSMVTIIAALLVGLNMVTAAEFSFLLALPTLGGATIYEGVKNWDSLVSSAGIDGLLVGMIVSGIVAALAVWIFVKWLTKHGLTPFGVYRILLAGAVYWYFFWN